MGGTGPGDAEWTNCALKLGDAGAEPETPPSPKAGATSAGAVSTGADVGADALWSGTNKYRDVSTGPLARPFARSLAPLTRSLAPDCSLRSRPPLCSLVRSLAHCAHSLALGEVRNPSIG